VTGASGVLGRGTARALPDRGDEVTVLQRRLARLPCREVLGDVSDEDVVRRAVAGQDAVVHLAGKRPHALPSRTRRPSRPGSTATHSPARRQRIRFQDGGHRTVVALHNDHRLHGYLGDVPSAQFVQSFHAHVFLG